MKSIKIVYFVLLFILVLLLLCFFYLSYLPKKNIEKYPVYRNISEALERPNRVYKLVIEKQSAIVEVEELKRFKRLQELYVYGELDTDTFPGDLACLKNLQSITISGANISMIDYKVQHFKYLNVLNLSNNRLKQFPIWVCYSKELTMLDLSSNELKELPRELSEMKKLKVLNLSNNQLENLPFSIGELDNLNLLNLTNNNLEELPSTIVNLYMNLDYLAVGGNQMTQEYYDWLVKNLPYTEIDTIGGNASNELVE